MTAVPEPAAGIVGGDGIEGKFEPFGHSVAGMPRQEPSTAAKMKKRQHGRPRRAASHASKSAAGSGRLNK